MLLQPFCNSLCGLGMSQRVTNKNGGAVLGMCRVGYTSYLKVQFSKYPPPPLRSFPFL